MRSLPLWLLLIIIYCYYGLPCVRCEFLQYAQNGRRALRVASLDLIDTSKVDFTYTLPTGSSDYDFTLGSYYTHRGLIVVRNLVSSSSNHSNTNQTTNKKQPTASLYNGSDCEEIIRIFENGTYSLNTLGDIVVGEFATTTTFFRNPSSNEQTQEWLNIISSGCNSTYRMYDFLLKHPEYEGVPLGTRKYYFSFYGPSGYNKRSQILAEGFYSITLPQEYNGYSELLVVGASEVHNNIKRTSMEVSFVGHHVQKQPTENNVDDDDDNNNKTPSYFTLGSIYKLTIPYSIIVYPKLPADVGNLLDIIM